MQTIKSGIFVLKKKKKNFTGCEDIYRLDNCEHDTVTQYIMVSNC